MRARSFVFPVDPVHELACGTDLVNIVSDLLAAAKADPVGFVDRLDEKVILDEIQHVPELFSSLKKTVDSNRQPGRFLLTGSTNVLLLPKLADSLAGRMEILNLRPLARCEIAKRGPGLLAQILRDDFTCHCTGKLANQLAGCIIAGGYPEPLQRRSDRRKNQWYQNYVGTLVQRDIRELARISNLEVVPKILQLAKCATVEYECDCRSFSYKSANNGGIFHFAEEYFFGGCLAGLA